ncbi:MAG TPA: histidine kinase dimerization/phospho-acceptor domain-containing protein, partial [Acidimicrobiales bacterium]|nr:histidine kinase dimerization/phospho-acceptor domain-containing protein [Acidimicrobiales bacterium]
MTGPAATGLTVDQLPDAVLELDVDCRVLLANAAAARLTGVGAEDLVGQLIADVLEPRASDGRSLCANGWHPSARLPTVTRIPEQEVWLRGAGGRLVRTLVTGRYERDAAGAVSGAVLVLRDGARRRPAVGDGIEVISTVSHELRSPLTSVKGYTSLLLNRWDRLGEDQKRMMLEQVHHDADRVTRLVTELLDISRLESGRLVLRRQMVDLVPLVNGVLEKVRMMESRLVATV